jgi:hypothetical protein
MLTNQSALFCLGQADLTSFQINRGSTTASNTLDDPTGLAIAGNYLFVGDSNNNRVLGYFLPGMAQGAAAAIVLGQSDFNSAIAASTSNATTMVSPQGIGFDGQHFAVADSGNSRVLVYNSVPTASGTAADIVLGQTDMSGHGWDHGTPSVAGADTLGNCRGVALADGRAFVADTGNNRLLVYDFPLSNGQAASVVLGQSTMTGLQQNRGGSVSAVSMENPTMVYVLNHHLFVVDSSNNRILVWNNDLALSNGQAADVVIGQLDFVSHASSNSASSFSGVQGVYDDGAQVFAADGVGRVLVFNGVPSTNAASATWVIGKSDFITGYPPPTVSSTSLDSPVGLASDGAHLFITSSNEERIMVYGCNLTLTPSPTPSQTPVPPTSTPAPTTALSPVPTPLIANFNGGITDVANGGNVQMEANSSSSTISQSAGPSSSLSGGTGSSLHLTGSIGRDDGTGVFAVAQISIFNGWTWAYIPPAAPDHALTFSYQADAISVGQQLRVSFQTGTDGFYSYVFTPTDTAWHQLTVYFPDVSGPSFTPQLVASAGTPAWSVGVFDIRSINFDIVASASAAQTFGFSVDDIHLGEPQSNSSPVQIATALGVTVAQVNDAYSYNLDEQLTWIVLLLAKDCGCSPDQIMTDRQTMSWGDVAVAVGTTWSAVLAQEAAAGLSAPVVRVDEMNRGLINGVLPAYTAPAQLYVPPISYAPAPFIQSCQ